MKHHLDVIIDSIESNSIIEQMEKILRFLQSDQDELCFLNLSTFMQQLLVNIVKNKENLGFMRLIYVSNGLSDVIYGVLESTKDIFTLVSEFETGKLNKKILCYKKLFHSPPGSSDYDQGMILQPHSNSQCSLHPLMARIEANNICQVDRCTLLQKVPKRKKKKNTQKQEVQSQDMGKVQKPDDLSPLFKRVTMQTILDFINDEGRATLVFQQKTKVEARFLISIMKKAKSNAHDDNIPVNCKPILMKIGASLKKFTGFNCNAMEGKVDKKTDLKDVTFVKNPNFNNDTVDKHTNAKATHSSVASDDIETLFSFKKLSHTSDNDVPDLTTLSITDNKKPTKFKEHKLCEQLSAPYCGETTPRIVQSNTHRDRSLSQRRKLSATRINFQPTSTKETEPVIDKAIDAIDNNRGRSHERRLDGRTSKLLADMSTPMKSDKAMRMMKGMGWDGGALGTRGDGITEPIIPELGIPRKAGLGHTLPKKPQPPPSLQQQQPLTTDFVNSIYETLFEFITSDVEIKQIDYKTAMNNKSMRFFRATVQAVNDRGKGNIRICNELYDLLLRIKERIKVVPNYRVEVNISSDHMRATLLKVPKKKKDRNVQPVNLIGHVSAQIFLQTIESLPKMILRLIQCEVTEMSVDFDDILSKGQCEFVDGIVKWLNRKSDDLSKTGSIFGKAIYSEIKERMQNIVLAAKFDGKSFKIIKICTDDTSYDAIDNNNTIIDSNYVFDTDVVMISDDESHTIPARNDIISNNDDITSKIDTKPIVETLIVTVGKYEAPVADPDDFDKCIRDLEMLFESEACDTEAKKEIKEESSWENLENKEFSYNNTTSDLGSEVSPLSKRTLSQTDSDIPIIKKAKLEPSHYKRVRIAPKSPDDVLNREKIKEFQASVSDAIDNSAQLTLLKCHGFINGALIYDCYDEKSFSFLKDVVDAASDLSIVERNEDLLESSKMSIKINSFIDVNIENFFNKIELYNPGLWTDDWIFIKKSEYSNFIIISVFVDDKSLKYISDANFSLFAGIDKIQFSIIWD